MLTVINLTTICIYLGKIHDTQIEALTVASEQRDATWCLVTPADSACETSTTTLSEPAAHDCIIYGSYVDDQGTLLDPCKP